MKLLVIGLDGGDLDIIRSMDMPFLQNVINKRVALTINEDLWSRGWSNIVSGKPGRETGALYNRPKLDGTANFSQSYSYKNYEQLESCELIWDKINKMNYKVGIVNMPTTIPAPKVKGFFVAGAGSGFSPSSRVPEEACYPKELAHEFLKSNYIWEQRFRVSGIRSADLFVERCISALSSRNTFFIKLCKSYKVDLGFVMHREFSSITNLFFHQILPILQSGGRRKNGIQRKLSELYRILDDQLRVCVNELRPEHIMVVSDHAVRPYQYSINLNAFLRKRKFLEGSKAEGSKSIYQKAKSFLVNKIRKINDPSYFNPKEDSWVIWNYDLPQSKAFSANYVPGIYINDDRFYGRVKQGQTQALISDIIQFFNSSEEAKTYSLKAKTYRQHYSHSSVEAYLPDIWIDLPDNMFPEQKGEFIQNNPYWFNYSDLTFIDRDMTTGIKGRNALCVVEADKMGPIDASESHELTAAYQLISNHFN